MDEKARKPGRVRRRLLWAALVGALLLAAFVLSVPFLLTHVPVPRLEFDLSPFLGDQAAGLFAERKATADVKIERGEPDGFVVSASGKICDWPYRAVARVRFGFVRAEGDVELELVGTGWKAGAEFEARGKRDWRFGASVPETRFSQDDALLAPLLAKATPPAISNLVFSGAFKLDAKGDCTPDRPVPAWTARASLADVGVAFETGGKAARVDGLRVRLGADGIADHLDVAPLFPRADSVEFAGFALSNVFASVRATERSYLVTEAGAECGGGQLKLYSLFLDPERLTAGATVFVDGVDAGWVLARTPCFRGEASGRLHGKLPFFLKDGKSLRIKDAYLFSTPGETGNLRIADSGPVLANLEHAGVDRATRENLGKALANLDYSVLRFELRRGGKDGEGPSLGLKVEGTATHGSTTVPVNLDITFRGDLDQLVDAGMGFSRRKR